MGSMNPRAAEKLQELLSQGRTDQVVALLQRLDPDAAIPTWQEKDSFQIHAKP